MLVSRIVARGVLSLNSIDAKLPKANVAGGPSDALAHDGGSLWQGKVDSIDEPSPPRLQ